MSDDLIKALAAAAKACAMAAFHITELQAKIRSMEIAQSQILILWLTYDLAEALLDATQDAIEQRARQEGWRQRVNPETGKAEIAVPMDLVKAGMGRQ